MAGNMCELQKTLTALQRLGHLRGNDAQVWIPLFEAMAKDTEEIKAKYKQSIDEHKAIGLRLENVEKDISEIRATMVRKEDLQQFKDELIPEIRKAAQFDLVKKQANWKTVVVFGVSFFVLVILFSFGIRGLEIIAPIGEKAVGTIK